MNLFESTIKQSDWIELCDFTRDGYRLIVVEVPKGRIEELEELAAEYEYAVIDADSETHEDSTRARIQYTPDKK